MLVCYPREPCCVIIMPRAELWFSDNALHGNEEGDDERRTWCSVVARYAEPEVCDKVSEERN